MRDRFLLSAWARLRISRRETANSTKKPIASTALSSDNRANTSIYWDLCEDAVLRAIFKSERFRTGLLRINRFYVRRNS
uniref:Uncharacterized protein n=1 Tax=Steinernema glaseri TaxID=37863 RepID=A0A1I8AN82_9BILA